jgi:gas vesicle protein
MSDNDNFGSFISGFVIGGIAGAITALLLAPQSGDETRKQIKEKSIELRDQASTYLDEVVTSTEKVVDEVSDKAGEFIDTTKRKAAEVAEKGQVLLETKDEKIAKAKAAPAKKASASKKTTKEE